MTEFSVTFLGTGATSPTARRGMPATYVRREGTKLLFDCGEGTQRQFHIATGGLPDVDAIFLTHYHTDHILGLPGLINTYALRRRETPLPIYGPKGLNTHLNRFRGTMGKDSYALIEPREVFPEDDAFCDDGFHVIPVGARHGRTGAVGYQMVEVDRPGRFDPEAARKLGIHPGPDFAKLQRGCSVGAVKPEDVMGPSRPGRKVVLSGDTSPSKGIREASQGVDLLIHEATLLEAQNARAHKTDHSTARDAAHLAAKAEAKRLALYHIGARNTDKAILKEAWEFFPGARLAQDFDEINLPLADG